MITERKYTLLVADADQPTRDMLNLMLSEQYEILFANNCDEGLRLLREHCKDVDVMLVNFPQPSTADYALLEEKAHDKSIAHIPVIVSTQSTNDVDEINCLQMGAADYLTKPYNPVALSLRIDNIIRLRQSTEANHQKAIFIQNISHEIHTPMNAIMGFCQFLRDPGISLSEEDLDMHYRFIIGSSINLMAMVDNMIVLSDIDSHSFAITNKHVAVNNLCRTAITETEYCVHEGITVNFTTDMTDETEVVIDEKYVKQILTNFISNACKFTQEGEVQVQCSDKEREGFLTLSVSDTGIGVPVEKADFIFERFAKVDSFVPGMGIGLSIARETALRMGGKAYLDIRHTPGARFVLEIPLG